jgi:hypothetical protein
VAFYRQEGVISAAEAGSMVAVEERKEEMPEEPRVFFASLSSLFFTEEINR